MYVLASPPTTSQLEAQSARAWPYSYDLTTTTRWYERRRQVLLVAGAIVALAVAIVVGLIVADSGGKSQPSALTKPTTINPTPRVVDTYENDTVQYSQGTTAYPAVVASDSADLAKQQVRIQGDQTTYDNNIFGSGCSADTADAATYSACVAQEHQTAAGALNDENAALAQEKTDAAQEISANNQQAQVISSYIQQLDSIRWPPPAQPIAANLTQDLSTLRNVLLHLASDLADNVDTTADDSALVTTGSSITAEQVNMDSALGISAPPGT
jgi:hypothetical protein